MANSRSRLGLSNISLQRTGACAPAAELGSFAIQNTVVAVALLLLAAVPGSVAHASAAESCACPSGQVEGGQKQLAIIRNITGEPVLVACGYRDPRSTTRRFLASGIELFRCGTEKPILNVDSEGTVVLDAKNDRLNITEMDKWPFGPGWKWVEVPVWQYVITSSSPDHVSRTMVLKPTQLTQRQIGDALDFYGRHANGAGVEDAYEDVIGRILLAALNGNAAAQRALSEMGATLNLDGDAGEVYQRATALYDAFASETGKVPRLVGR